MSVEKVRKYLSAFGADQRIQEFNVSSATVELAAIALNCEPCRIAKSLAFMTPDGPILVVAAGDAKVDNPRYKAQFGCKAKMLTPDEAVKCVNSGDWVDIAHGSVFPILCEEALSKRADELYDIKLRGEKILGRG